MANLVLEKMWESRKRIAAASGRMGYLWSLSSDARRRGGSQEVSCMKRTLGALDRQDMHYAPANRLQGKQTLPDSQANASSCKCVTAYAGTYRHTDTHTSTQAASRHADLHRVWWRPKVTCLWPQGRIYTDSYKGGNFPEISRLHYHLLWGLLNIQCQSIFADS